jgi:hypothetical protein
VIFVQVLLPILVVADRPLFIATGRKNENCWPAFRSWRHSASFAGFWYGPIHRKTPHEAGD